jgi:hypothetical protein
MMRWRWLCWIGLHDHECVWIHDSGSPAAFKCRRCGYQEICA